MKLVASRGRDVSSSPRSRGGKSPAEFPVVSNDGNLLTRSAGELATTTSGHVNHRVGSQSPGEKKGKRQHGEPVTT